MEDTNNFEELEYYGPEPTQHEVPFNGCKHVRSMTRLLPKGYEAKKKAKRKSQRAARKVKK